MTELRGLVRDRDPFDTSWAAAASQTKSKIELSKIAILKILRDNPQGKADHEIEVAYNAIRDRLKLPPVSGQALRTRRKSLQIEGRVRDSGRRTNTPLGHKSIVWVTK